jgi:arylsulfatase A-like enzyme
MGALVPLATWVAGSCLAFALLRRSQTVAPPWLVAASLGPAAGFGLLSIAYLLWRLAGLGNAGFQVAGWPAIAVLAGASVVVARRRPGRREATRLEPPATAALVLFCAGLALAVIALILYTRQQPYGSFDAWAIWNSRARLLYRGADLREIFSLLHRPHPDYPLLLPGSLAAQSALAGGESPWIHQVTGALFAFSTSLAVVAGVLQLGAARCWAFLAGGLLLCTPKFLYWGASQCADVPLAYALLLATIFLAALLSAERSPPLPAFVVGFLVGLPAWTKNEGMILSALLLVLFLVMATVAARRGNRRPARRSVLAGALVPWLALALFRWLWAPRSDLQHFAGDLLSRLLQPQRWGHVALAFGREFVSVAGFRLWGTVWIVAAVALAVGLARGRPADGALWLGRWILAAAWCAWFGVFVGTPLDLDWHLRTALDRLLLQLLPLTLTVGFAALQGLGGSATEREPGAPRRAAAAALTILLAACLLVACGHPARGPGALRLIEDPPTEMLDTLALLRENQVVAWEPTLATDPRSGWVVDSGEVTATADGLTLVPGDNGRATVVREVSIDAATVDVLRLVRPQVAGGSVTLYWASVGERFTKERQIRVLLEGRREGFESDNDVVLVPRGHPEWRGVISSLRLDYGNPRARLMRLRTLRASHRAIDPRALAAAAAQPWRVELDHERRSAFVASQERDLTWAVPELSDQQLSFGFGIEASSAGTTTFRVVADRGAASDEIFVARVGAGADPADRWRDVVLPAADTRGATTLHFAVEYPAAEAERTSLAYWSHPELRRSAGGARRPDILLVSLDTLRPDHLSLYGYPRPTSPELDLWARSAVVFEKTVTAAPWTLPAHLSLLTGLDAVHHGVNHRGRAPQDLTLLAESLRRAGYETQAITGGGFLDPQYGLDQGFDRYRYWPEHTAEEELVTAIAAAERWLAEPSPRPLFLFFHTYETHYPYRARSPFFERFAAGHAKPNERDLGYVNMPTDEEDGWLLAKEWRSPAEDGSAAPLDAEQQRLLVALYDSGIAFADSQIGRLLARWGERPRADASIVAVTSDHGEALGEKGVAGHAYLEDFNALVPLVVRFPGGRPAGRVATQVRLIDLAPTLLEVAGLAPPANIDGASLLELARVGKGEPRPGWTYSSFANRGLALRLADRWKYIFNNTAWKPLQGREALYDLRRDPREENPLPTDPERLAALRRRAQAHLAQTASAIRIRVDNPSPNRVTGRLVGAVLEPSRLKSPGLPQGGLTRLSPSGVDVLADGGESFELVLESPAPGSLTIVLESGFRARVDLTTLEDPWRVVRRGDRWALGDRVDAAEPVATLVVEWMAGGGTATEDPAHEDAELRRQLEALGYVE